MRLFFERVWGWLLENIGRGLNIFFHYGLSQGVSKIGPTHQLALSIDLKEYKNTPAETRRISLKAWVSLQPIIPTCKWRLM